MLTSEEYRSLLYKIEETRSIQQECYNSMVNFRSEWTQLKRREQELKRRRETDGFDELYKKLMANK